VAKKAPPAAAGTTTKTPVLRLVTVNSDETRVDKPTRTVSLYNPDSGRTLQGVTATVAMLSDDDYAALEKKHRNIPEKGPAGVTWKLDHKALILEILTRTVQAWTGIALRRHDMNKTHLAGVAKTPAEVVDAEVVAASFRQPATVG
jgi:hypothetical protein